MNFGAFAGGIATGYMAGKEQQRKDAEEKRKQGEYEREDAYRKEMEGITSPDDAHKEKLAEYEKARKQAEVESSTARTSAEVVGNPVAAQGIRLPASKFSEDTAQRGAENTLAPSRPSSAPSIIAANGIGASNAMRAEIAKPEQAAPLEAPKAPGINDWLDFATKRAAIDWKHGKLNGLGMMQLAQARKQLMDEGVDEAVMKFQQGDAAGGLESFNASGKYVGAKLVGEPQRGEFDYNGVKMPTTIVTLKLPDGRTETINTAQYGTSRIKAENQFSAAMDMLKHKDNKAHQDSVLKNQSKEIGIKQSEHAEKQKEAAAQSGWRSKIIATKPGTPEYENLMRAGVIMGYAKTDSKQYKIEGSEVATVLGDPAVDKNGKPVVDIMSGRQVVNRNPVREDAFYKWMAQNGITDTNEGLAKYKGNPQVQPPAQASASLPPGAKQVGTSGGKPVYQTPDGKRFIGE